jgi:hypothetical protein
MELQQLKEELQNYREEVNDNTQEIKELTARIRLLEKRNLEIRGSLSCYGLLQIAKDKIMHLEAIEKINKLPCAIGKDGKEIELIRVSRITPKRIYYYSMRNPTSEDSYQIGKFNYEGLDFDKTRVKFEEYRTNLEDK